MHKTLTAILVTLVIPMGIAWSHPVYDERGNIVGETLEEHTDYIYGAQGDGRTTVDLRFPEAPAGKECNQSILALLHECLEFIDDSSVIYNDPSDRDNYLTESVPAIYQLGSAQTDADDSAQAAQEQADRMRERAERCRRETELHHRIVEMIKKLEPKEKKK